MNCRVCSDKLRPEIDRALLAGEPLRVLAENYGFSTAGLSRHARKHVQRVAAPGSDANEERSIKAWNYILGTALTKGDLNTAQRAQKALDAINRRARLAAPTTEGEPSRRMSGNELVAHLRAIYGLGPAEEVEHLAKDKVLVAELGELVERSTDVRICALATRLASLLTRRPLLGEVAEVCDRIERESDDESADDVSELVEGRQPQRSNEHEPEQEERADDEADADGDRRERLRSERPDAE